MVERTAHNPVGYSLHIWVFGDATPHTWDDLSWGECIAYMLALADENTVQRVELTAQAQDRRVSR